MPPAQTVKGSIRPALLPFLHMHSHLFSQTSDPVPDISIRTSFMASSMADAKDPQSSSIPSYRSDYSAPDNHTVSYPTWRIPDIRTMEIWETAYSVMSSLPRLLPV